MTPRYPSPAWNPDGPGYTLIGQHGIADLWQQDLANTSYFEFGLVVDDSGNVFWFDSTTQTTFEMQLRGIRHELPGTFEAWLDAVVALRTKHGLTA